MLKLGRKFPTQQMAQMLPGVYLCVSTIGFSSMLGAGGVHGRVARALDLQFAAPGSSPALTASCI